MAKKLINEETSENAEGRDAYCASVLLRAACGLKTTSACYWDDLDHLLEHIITDEAHAKRLVDALMTFGPDAAVHRHDAWEASEEVAIRIIGNYDLRFTNAAAPSAMRAVLVLAKIGPNKILVIKVVREHMAMGLKEAKDLVEGPTPVVVFNDRADAEAFKQQLEAAGATVDLRGAR